MRPDGTRTHHQPRRVRRSTAAVVLLMAVALVAGVLTPTAASAAPTAPTGLTSSASLSGNPELKWNPVPGATRYRVQTSTISTFASTIESVETVNTTYIPPAAIPTDVLHWRVAAIDSTGRGPDAVAQYTRPALTGPSITAPADDAVFRLPIEPPEFSWNPRAGSKSYVLQIATNDTFTSPQTFNVDGTKLTITNQGIPDQPYYWRVRGASNTGGGGIQTDWSPARQFIIRWDGGANSDCNRDSGVESTCPQPVYPAYDRANPGTVQVITDVVMAWRPFLGAKNYQLQVSLNQDFAGGSVLDTTVFGTQYSPPTTFDNGSYWWRVRARDQHNRLGPWTNPWQFTRQWNEAPTLLSPADAIGSLSDPVRFAWNPISHASMYDVQVTTDPNFNTGIQTCVTTHTEVTLHTNVASVRNACGFNLAYDTQYYWRVRGRDDPKSPAVESLWSERRTFSRVPQSVAYQSPANNTTVTTPVLSWAGVDGANRYTAVVKDKDGATVQSLTTVATTFTPSTALTAAKSPYSWYVTYRNGAQESPVPPSGSWRAFSIGAATTAATPDVISPSGGSTPEMPSMTWKPVSGATRYKILYRPQGLIAFSTLRDNLGNTAWTSPDNPIAPGTYDWKVEAYNGSTLIGESSTLGAFVITALDDIGYANATNFLLPALSPELCGSLAVPCRSTPYFDWDPVVGASNYIVWVALDANFTNVIRRFGTSFSTFRPSEELPDNDAGAAYYWHVQACKPGSGCSLDPSGRGAPSGSFRKNSPAVTGLEISGGYPGADPWNPSTVWPTSAYNWSPNTGTVQNAPLFKWDDFVESGATPNGTQTQVGTRQYRIQVSNTINFQSLIDDKTVDQTFYMPTDRTYPEGPLYWRVRAIDGYSNQLTWRSSTETGTSTTKASPLVQLSAPANGASVSTLPTLQWQAAEFAAEYQVEIYKNGLDPVSTANRIVNSSTSYTRFASFSALPPGVYRWRVRTEDGQGKDGVWLAERTFTLTGYNPSPTSPGALQPSSNPPAVGTDNIVYRWDATGANAASFRFQRSATPTFASIAETRDTIMTAWAPTAKVPDGVWYWRVLALNNKGDVMSDTNPSSPGYVPVRTFIKGVQALPSEPRNVVLGVDKATLSLRWQAPSTTGGALFNGYTVTLNPGNVTLQLPTSATTHTFRQLTNGTPYTVTIRAKTSGPLGGVSNLVTRQATPNGCSGTKFADVGTAFCSEIRWMYDQGITTGSVINGSIYYKPGEPVLRGAMAAFLYRARADNAEVSNDPHFADVGPSHPFFKQIQWMYESKNSTGTANPTGKPLYKPNQPISRGGIAAFMHRAGGGAPSGLTAPYFADVPQGTPFYEDIQWMGAKGISTGSANGVNKPLYGPNSQLIRQAMSAFLFRLDQLP